MGNANVRLCCPVSCALLLVCEGRRARHVAYTSSFFFLAAAVDIRVNNPTVNVGIQQLNNNAVVWLHLRMLLAQGQDPKCDIPGVTAYGTVTDPAISPFCIRTSSIDRTRNFNNPVFPYSILFTLSLSFHSYLSLLLVLVYFGYHSLSLPCRLYPCVTLVFG